MARGLGRLFRYLAPFALGTTLGGLMVGAAEGAYRAAPLAYSALLYGALWAVVGVCCGLPIVALAARRAKVRLRCVTAGASVALGSSALILVRFIAFRDFFLEAPDRQVSAWLIGAAAGASAVLVAQVVGRWLGHRLMLESLATPWLLVAPAAVLTAFCVRAVADDTKVPESAPPPRHALQGRGVILVVVDALRADALGVYGAGPHRNELPSPNIDAFAKDGRVFLDASAQASWTRPAMASLLTSRHASAHATMGKTAVLPEALPTIASVLSESPSASASPLPSPSQSGSGKVATAAVVTNYNLEPAYGFARGFADYRYLAPARYLGAPEAASRLAAYNVYRLVREKLAWGGREARYFYRPAAAVNAQALSMLDTFGDADFFLLLHYMEPHDPYFAVTGASYARVSTPKPPLTAAEAMRNAYRDEVRRFDSAFGELLAGLRARGLLDRVTIVLTADHGEELAEHGGFYHGLTLYEEMLHVPLIIAGPGIAKGTEPGLVRQIDIAPTIVRRFGAAVPPSWEGRDLLAAPVPGAGPAPAVAPSSADLTPPETLAEEDHEGNVLQAIRLGRAKLITANADNPRGLKPLELYDLASDPREQRPLDDAARAAALRSRLTTALQEAQKGGAKATTRTLDAASEAALRSLGYVQ